LEYILQINLFSNSLSGSLPSNIQNLKVLIGLDLSINRLYGDIPITISGLKDLTTLFLAGNRSQGSIPKSFESLASLEFLDLSSNNLSGKIPKSLEALSNLKELNVSYNRLEGEIPTNVPFGNFSSQSFISNYALCAHQDSKRTSYLDILQATDEFNEWHLLGTESLGSVYKWIFLDETNVAIKVFNLQLERAFRSFDSKCEVHKNVRHRNLIKILTTIAILILKPWYLSSCVMPNGDFPERLNIMIDMALAFEYLHHGRSTPMVHCDLKPSNNLLDEDMVAHVSDFNISKLLGVLLPETFTRKKPTIEMIIG
ncbi:hypothetical protein CISIN_1g036266mg, partial [Citrus sinensis]